MGPLQVASLNTRNLNDPFCFGTWEDDVGNYCCSMFAKKNIAANWVKKNHPEISKVEFPKLKIMNMNPWI